ncbi:MAG: hypothetical protein LBT65_07645 [Synergistaceae bacterium]|nr:hypothetical protein [Synergistaceae bacterium]
MLVFLLVSLSGGHGNGMSTEVAYIISELRGMKAAARMYIDDRKGDLSNLSEGENYVAVLAPYGDDPDEYTTPNTVYAFRVIDGVGWVGYSLDKAKKTPDACEKLAGRAARAANVGLLILKSPSIDVTHLYTRDAKAVWIRAF